MNKTTDDYCLRCPDCGRLHTLGHDEWSAIVCLGCQAEIHRDKRSDIMKVIRFLNSRIMIASVKSREEAVEAAKGLSASEIVDAYIQAVRKL